MESFTKRFKKDWDGFVKRTNVAESAYTGDDYAFLIEIEILANNHQEVIEKLKYEISLLGLSEEELTGVNNRIAQL